MSSTPQLRVMTYDVGALRGDIEALATVVQAHSPDVLLVQEAPRFLRWRSKRAALARRCGLVVATTDRPGGLCILTSLRVDLVATTFAVLPTTSRRSQRSVVGATVSQSGTQWRVATTQLGAEPAERRAQLPALWSALAVDGEPLVLGADLGVDPDPDLVAELVGRLPDCAAAAGSTSARHVILADPSVTVVSCQVVADPGVERASRHRPVVAVLSR